MTQIMAKQELLERAIEDALKRLRQTGFKVKKGYSYGIYGVAQTDYLIRRSLFPGLDLEIGEFTLRKPGFGYAVASDEWSLFVYGKKDYFELLSDLLNPIAKNYNLKFCVTHASEKPRVKTPVHKFFDFIEYAMECGDSAEAH